jgi:hypothetical protein
MVKNYLVCAVRPIEDGWHLEKNKDLYAQYRQMYDLSLASFHKFVAEPFEAVIWTDPVKNNDEYTVTNWNAIKELWHSDTCNIFWAGADTLMTQPTSLFSDRFKEYRLFNYTDPKTYRGYVNYFNDDLQYYPHTMSKETWDVGEQLWSVKEGHPDQFWGFDQLRHNEMFWSQGIPQDDWYHPELAYQAMRLRELNQENVDKHNEWNGIPLQYAHILHFHASRGSQQVIDLMRFISKEIGVI